MSLMSPIEFYSTTMPEADAKFRAACRKMGGEAVFYKNPLNGPNGEFLHTAEFLLGSKDAENVIIFASGMHGIEGYAGAGFQIGLMESGALEAVPDAIAILFVHMINPWGCAWGMRENEDNVDIFRNLVYGEKNSPPNPEYDELNEFLNPTEWSGLVKQQADAGLAAYIEKSGFDNLLRVMRFGQHNHPHGLTFHGVKPTWSRTTLEEIAKRNLVNARKIVPVDLHSGLGEDGGALVVSYHHADSEVGRRLSDWYGEGIYFGGDPMIPKHEVFALDTVARVLPDPEIFGIGLEFGADQYTFEENFNLFRYMNYLRNYGDPLASEAKNALRRYRGIFYGESDEWRKKSWENGLKFFEQTLAGSCKWFEESRS